MGSTMPSPAGIRANTVVLSFTLLAGVIVFLRLFTRIALIKKAGFEDVCIATAMLLSLGLTVAISEQVMNGMGAHIYDLSEGQITASNKAFWASVWLYNLALTTTKISMLVQYLRIFPIHRFRIACYVVLGLVSTYGVWTLFGSIFLCFPVEFFWDKSIEDGQCLNQAAIWFTNGAMNIAQDFVIIMLPLPVLRSLTINKAQKRALIIVFSLGGVVCLISILRLHSLIRISNSTDPTYDNPAPAAFSSVETNVGIIVACLPVMRPLLHAMMPSYFPETSRYPSVPTHDEEQPKQVVAPASTQPHTGRESSRSPRSQKGGSKNSKNTSRRDSALTDLSNGDEPSVPPSTRPPAVHSQHKMNPLRMSPFSPTMPTLPRLPENLAPTESPRQSWHRKSPSSPRTPRHTPHTPVFSKPLPITPFPVN